MLGKDAQLGATRWFGEAGVAIVVVAIIALMILPLPPEVIDALLSMNIAASILILMVTIYIPDVVSLSSFPSLLLFTTLFRLSLNIASTKSILLHADAGRIIETFGMLVVGGNLVVGLVVFVITTIVQFIVIAKGAERVAEVGARFCLDGLPGKQMSIDADLRAGLLRPEEARSKRIALAIESQLHGGMDGAMKFVKGDAIAGILITVVNIFAGIAVGIMYHGMAASDAANRFAVLSIGDAMVSQIPSLLLSVAAGIMITRVSDERSAGRGSLGKEIATQLGSSSKALYYSAALLGGFAIVPGFPILLFGGLAVASAVGGWKIQRRAEGKALHSRGVVDAMQRAGAKNSIPAVLKRAPEFTCAVGVRLSPSLAASMSMPALQEAFEIERASLQNDLGLPFPGITMWIGDMERQQCQILLHDVPCKEIYLDARDMDLDQTTNKGGVGPEIILAREISNLLRSNAPQFFGIEEVQWVLNQLGIEHPQIVSELTKTLSLLRIADVCKRLLEEQVSIRNVRAIAESLVTWAPKEKDPLLLTEYVRGDLCRYLAHRASAGRGHLDAILLDLTVEQQLRAAIKQTPVGNYLALPPQESEVIVDAIRDFSGETPREGVAIVVSMDLRRYVRRLVQSSVPWLPVYSYQELGELVTINCIGRVGHEPVGGFLE